MPAVIPTQDPWTAHYARPDGFRWWPCEELVRAIAGRRFGTLLEAGCGNGANLWYLTEHADKVLGVDGNRAALEAATAYLQQRRIPSDRYSLCVDDVLRLEYIRDESVDAVVDVMTGQHVPWPDYPRLLAQYRRVLRPGGWLFFYNLGWGTTIVGARQVAPATYDQLPKLFPGVGPVCLPQPQALTLALVEAKFHPERVRKMTRTYADGSVASYLVQEATAI